jgi:hypothetical protein
MTEEMDPKEAQEIMRIATEYARGASKTEEEAQKLMGALAAIVQEDSAKLVHLGNVLFLVLVRGKELVEVHTIGDEKKPRDLAQNFLNLAKYLKGIGVKVAYTYTPDTKFSKLAKMVDLKVQQYKSNVQGQMMNVFVVEL